jgi:hypothetical protein
MLELSSARISHDECDARQTADDEPQSGSGKHEDRQRPAVIEHPRAGPGQREGGEQQHIGEIDGDQIGRGAVGAEERDRAGTQEIGKTPPRHGMDRSVLHPGKQQQQSEDRFHIDRDNE